LELPHGRSVLYDCGRMGSPYVLAGAVANTLWSRGRFGLDAAIISHADADHFSALGPLLEMVSARRIFAAPHVIHSQSPLLLQLKKTVAERKRTITALHDKLRFPIRSSATVRVLHPPPLELPSGDNANSVVLAIEYGGQQILLPGDLESSGLDRLLARPPTRCQLLMAPHHGSLHSRPLEMVNWARPQWIVLSSKSRPATPWLELRGRAGAAIYDTRSHNAIRCQIDARGRSAWQRWNGRQWEDLMPPGKHRHFRT
jgi:competence protein ComEC